MTPTPGIGAGFAEVDSRISPAEPNLDLVLEIATKHSLTWALPAD